MMKMALGQINPTVGDFRGNVKKMAAFIEKAREGGAHLIVFPELSLVGYPPLDFLDYPPFVDSVSSALEALSAETKGITVVCGLVEPNPEPNGQRYLNSVAILKEGERIGVYHKHFLPNYDVFDERRYFEPGRGNCTFSVDGHNVAITVCEDLWNHPEFTSRPYSNDPFQVLGTEPIDLILNLSASPFHLGKPAQRVDLFREVAKKNKASVVFCNQVGANDELVFDGCSFVLDSNGQFVAKGAAFGESLVISDVKRGVRTEGVTWPEVEAEWHLLALELGIRDYAKKSGVHRVCLGLSGGIDSSVVAVVAQRALGGENVFALSLPSRFTSSASQEDARILAENLGIDLESFSIEPVFERFEALWQEQFGAFSNSLTCENIQPRLRMTALMALANERQALLLNTSNKSELAMGYSTLYGDSAGALSVLGDLTKNEVYALAKYVNRQETLIPERVIQRPPTAELRPNQKDEDSLPPYAAIDSFVQKMVNQSQRTGKEALSSPQERALWEKYVRNEYKRYQSPPVLRLSSRAFGFGRRMPLAAKDPLSFLQICEK